MLTRFLRKIILAILASEPTDPPKANAGELDKIASELR